MIETMITTFDNPHSPFDEFKAWYAFDTAHGYHTVALLARLQTSSEELSETDQRIANEQLIDELVRENVTGMFKKVTREVDTDELIPLE